MDELQGQNFIKDNKDTYSVSLDFPHEEVVNVLNKKSSKILTALYMITHFVPKGDPLRSALRKSGINILSHINHYAHTDSLTSQKNILGALQEIEHCLSLINVSNGAGYISDMNHRVITEAIGKLKSNLKMLANVTRKSPSHELELSEELSVEDNIFESFKKNSYSAKSPLKDKATTYKGQKDNVSKGQNLSFTKKPSVSSPSRKDRVEAIINSMKGKGKVSVSDISAPIKDWSQKTIQREINNLVKDNKVRRFGEKRWSTYELIE